MPKEYFKFIGAVHLFLIKDEKILLLRRYKTGYEDGNYSVPAGHMDGNEKASAAMIREAKEEAGVDIKPEQLHLAHVMHRISVGTHPSGTDERIDFFFTATAWQGEPHIMEPNKCDDLSWFPINQLPDNVIPYIRTAVKNYQRGTTFSEFGWE